MNKTEPEPFCLFQKRRRPKLSSNSSHKNRRSKSKLRQTAPHCWQIPFLRSLSLFRVEILFLLVCLRFQLPVFECVYPVWISRDFQGISNVFPEISMAFCQDFEGSCWFFIGVCSLQPPAFCDASSSDTLSHSISLHQGHIGPQGYVKPAKTTTCVTCQKHDSLVQKLLKPRCFLRSDMLKPRNLLRKFSPNLAASPSQQGNMTLLLRFLIALLSLAMSRRSCFKLLSSIVIFT